PQRQLGERAQHLDRSLRQVIDPAAVIAGHPADQDPKHEADRDADQADGERDAGADKNAREHIAAGPVGAEQEGGAALGRAEQVKARRNDAPPAVGIAQAEEAQLFHARRIGRVFAFEGGHVEVIAKAIHERPDEAALVKQMHALRRRVDEVGVTAVQVVGRQELAGDDRSIEQDENDTREHGEAVAPELPPHHPPLRGEIEPLLLLGQPLDRLRIEGLGRDVMVDGSRHRTLPPPNRMRGSSAASARSDKRTPTTVSSARNIRNEPAKYMSWLRKASNSIGPVVGSDSTTETMTAPETTCGNKLPISAMNAVTAMRSGYFNNSRPGGRPFARAVTT